MSLTGNGSKSIRRQDVQEQKSIAIGLKKLVMAHKATLADTGINLSSLNTPSEMSSLGFTNPSAQEILAANLKFYRSNLRIVSSHKGLLMDYLSYNVTSSSRIDFTGFTAEADEIFVITFDDNAKTGVTMVDSEPIMSTGELAVGVTDFNTGVPYEVGVNATTKQAGRILVFRNGAIQFRNPNNGTTGGNYQEVPAGSGLGVIVRFNNAPVGQPDNILVVGLGTAYRPDGSVLAEIETLAGQLDIHREILEEVTGETIAPGAPNNTDLKAFGDTVLALLEAQIPIETSWASFTPVFNNAPTNTVLTPWICRRKGENLEVEGAFTATGTGGVGTFALHPPTDVFPGITMIDTQCAGVSLGYATGGSLGYEATPAFVQSNLISLVDNDTGSALSGSVITSGDIVTFKVSIRITGWARSQTLRQQLGL